MKVSVIIPVFNAEKFLGACLESILNQTLQDFEVIAVDDCSTDNSIVVAENFLEKFGGRLKIISLPKNSGAGSVPRNEGLKFSRGKYIFFLDADDLLMPDALKTFYDAAEKFSADVVHTERAFTCEENSPQNLTPVLLVQTSCLRNKIFMESDDLAERLDLLLHSGCSVLSWAKFSRRDFLLANDIEFPQAKIGEDALWTIQVVCLAKNFLRISNPLYVWRTAKNSVTRTKRTPQNKIKVWLDSLINCADWLDDFMDGIEFFARNPKYRFDLMDAFIKGPLTNKNVFDAFKELNRSEIYDIIHGMFEGRRAALISYLLIKIFSK